MKIHLISLNQDLEDARNNVPLNEDEYYESDAFYMGAIDATEHLLSVATDIMNSTNERYE
jgi:ribosomal 30S subunit maturation factor RimM